MRQQQKIHKTNQNKISITTTSVGGDDDYNDAADDDYSNDEYDDNYNNVNLKVKVENLCSVHLMKCLNNVFPTFQCPSCQMPATKHKPFYNKTCWLLITTS